MARIRMLVSVAGEFDAEAGQVVDLPGPQAKAWADGVRAVMVRSEPLETPEAAQDAPEKAAARARTRKAPPRKD